MSNSRYDIKRHSQPLIYVSGTEAQDRFLAEAIKTLDLSWADILEFDPLTLGVKELRSLISQLEIKPHSSKWRLLVVKRADYMNEAQANTLLKTLEEPPCYARIIIFAQNLSKLLPTIRSRCHRVFGEKSKRQSAPEAFIDLRADFSQFLKQLSLIENEKIPDILELIFLNERDRVAKGKQKSFKFYKRAVESYLSSKSTNVNRKLLLENLWVLAKKLDRK